MQNTIFRSLWFWWFLLTAIYLLFNAAGYPTGGDHDILLGYVAGAVGLFVPFGFLSLLLLMSPTTWLSIPVFLISMWYGEKKLKEKNYSYGKKVLMNLLVLLMITILVDFARMTPWASWSIFLGGGLNFGF
jgi:hypothetical protein